MPWGRAAEGPPSPKHNLTCGRGLVYHGTEQKRQGGVDSVVSKVLALHDMVCLGRCSLTVVIPALSAQGMKVCPLPTALLSSDTGGFGPVYVRELTS